MFLQTRLSGHSSSMSKEGPIRALSHIALMCLGVTWSNWFTIACCWFPWAALLLLTVNRSLCCEIEKTLSLRLRFEPLSLDLWMVHGWRMIDKVFIAALVVITLLCRWNVNEQSEMWIHTNSLAHCPIKINSCRVTLIIYQANTLIDIYPQIKLVSYSTIHIFMPYLWCDSHWANNLYPQWNSWVHKIVAELIT